MSGEVAANYDSPVVFVGRANIFWFIGSDAMWVMIEEEQVIEFAQTSEVSKTSEVYGYHPHCITTGLSVVVVGWSEHQRTPTMAMTLE